MTFNYDVLIVNNYARNGGGGIAISNNGSLYSNGKNLLIVNNTAKFGGGLYIY